MTRHEKNLKDGEMSKIENIFSEIRIKAEKLLKKPRLTISIYYLRKMMQHVFADLKPQDDKRKLSKLN